MSRRGFAARDLQVNLKEDYSSFSKIDGTHEFQNRVPNSYILYPVRRLEKGKISYFNFKLAKEMGLISEYHPEQLNSDLENVLLNTFCLQIINEYDQNKNTKFNQKRLKSNKYMATRYLQLQHKNKKGTTSGDGRSIWNGSFKNPNPLDGRIWDISSRGTGVTALAPGSVEAQRPLKTGAAEFGYGCGLADLDELYGSAIMSEIFHRQDINTERVLCIIDIGNSLGIGVRAHPNLLRPAHMFMHLKQNNYTELKACVDYFIERQNHNKIWNLKTGSFNVYTDMLVALSKEFASFVAKLERHYIFVWMDWDGDNLLAHPGIIDYGSVRQFGLRHDQYRYDDVDRFSTNLNEQKKKALNTIQVFSQMVDYLQTNKKKSISKFKNSKFIKIFNEEFEKQLRLIFLLQVGFSTETSNHLLDVYAKEVENLFQIFSKLEKTKTSSKIQKVPDGKNRPAIFNMRKFLRNYPAALSSQFEQGEKINPITDFIVFDWFKSEFSNRKDRKLKTSTQKQIQDLQKAYIKLVKICLENKLQSLQSIQLNSNKLNIEKRITGNCIEYLVEDLFKSMKSGLSTKSIYEVLESFYQHQTPTYSQQNRSLVNLNTPEGKLLQKLLDTCREFEEDI